MGEQVADSRWTVAFLLSLLAGVWMVGTGAMSYAMGWHHMGRRMPVDWLWCHGMTGHLWGGPRLPSLGIVAGVVVLTGATLLYSNPQQNHRWAPAILICSLLNLLLGTGGLLASLFGIIGGALFLSFGQHSYDGSK